MVHTFLLTKAASTVTDPKSTEACHEKRPGWRWGGHCRGGQQFVTAGSLRLCLAGPKQVVVHSNHSRTNRRSPLLYLALGTPPWKFKEVLEIPNLLGFPVPPWNSNTTQKSKEVWEFQGYQLISSFLGIPIPPGNSHTCKNLIKRGIGFPRRVWEIQGDRCLWTSGDT